MRDRVVRALVTSHACFATVTQLVMDSPSAQVEVHHSSSEQAGWGRIAWRKRNLKTGPRIRSGVLLLIDPLPVALFYSEGAWPRRWFRRELVTLPLVSVVIPNHNYARFLRVGIESVLAQDVDSEVLVVDNGSTDNSLEVLREFGASIRVLAQGDLGQAAARNRGILESRGDFIAFLDADDFWYSGKLVAQMELMANVQEASLVSCNIWKVNASGKREQVMAQPKAEVSLNDFMRQPQVGWVLCGESTALIRRSSLARTGLLDPNLSTASGWDLFRRLASVGRLLSAQECLAAYRVHGQNTSLKVQAMVRDMRYAYAKACMEAKGSMPWRSRYMGGLSLARSISATQFLRRDYREAATAMVRGVAGKP